VSVSAPAFFADWRHLKLSWKGFADPESAVTAYALCLRTAGAAVDDVLPCTALPGLPSAADLGALAAEGVISEEAAANVTAVLAAASAAAAATATTRLDQVRPTLTTVVPRVIAINGAGLQSIVLGPGIILDAAAPSGSVLDVTPSWYAETGGAVTTGAMRPMQAHATTSQSQLAAAWPSWATVGPSGIAGFEYAFGTACGRADAWPRTPAGDARSVVTTRPLALARNKTYYTSLWVITGAGVESLACSIGIVVDLQPPEAGIVRDGPGGDPTVDVSQARYIGAPNVTVRWGGFWDADSAIAEYRVRVCDAAVDPCSSNWTSIGMATNATLLNLGLLVLGHTYVTTVMAVDYAGWSATASSPGVVFDITPPIAAAELSVTPVVASSFAQVAVAWSPFLDAESTVVDYTWNIGSAAYGADLVPPT
jgi:hypothetical protein